MATTAYNNIIRGGAQGRSIFPSLLPVISTSVSFNQGDLLTFNTSTNVVQAAVTGQSDKLLGVAINTIVLGIPKSPYQGTAVDASEGLSDMGGPLYSVVATLILDTGSTLVPGQKVYVSNTDAQHVTPTQPGSDTACGVYSGSQGSLSGSAAGQKVDILIGATYAMTGLHF